MSTGTPSTSATTPGPGRILQTGLGFWASKVLLSAVELGLFTELAQEPLEAVEIGRRLELHPRAVLDFLDALVALGFLERATGRYANSREAAIFLDRNQPSYVGGILEMANARLYSIWGQLTQALRSGQPQNEIANASGNPFLELYSDPQRLRGFLHAMTGVSLGSGRAIAAQFPWAKVKTVADIGTAQGGCLAQIAMANPHLSGIGFDLPPVQPIFEEYMAAQGLAGRVRFQAGDFWKDPLPQSDVLVMGHILQDWSLGEKKALVAKAFAALPPGGALIVHDPILDDDRRQNAFGLLMSLNMLMETPGGFSYTGSECMSWMREAGFTRTEMHPLEGPNAMAVGYK